MDGEIMPTQNRMRRVFIRTVLPCRTDPYGGGDLGFGGPRDRPGHFASYEFESRPRITGRGDAGAYDGRPAGLLRARCRRDRIARMEGAGAVAEWRLDNSVSRCLG